MTENKDEYPVATVHRFLEEASKEFRRFRFQAKVNLVGSIILLLLLSRFLLFAFGHFGPPPFSHYQTFPPERPPPTPFIPDFVLTLAALAAVFWSLYVWVKQRRFVSRWGSRFEKLDALERKLLPDESS
jgi:amino acid transporter